jgi:hypothetical protein
MINLAAVVLVFTGCYESVQKPTPKGGAAKVAAKPELLQPLVWTQPPTTLVEVAAARSGPVDEVVHVVGIVPPGKVGPFNPAVASIILMDPTDLAKEEVKTEFECDDAATCPKCRKLLNSLALYVELVDDKGQVIPTTLEGFSGLKPGSRVAFSGTLKRGDKNGPTRLIATRFAVRPGEAG